MDRAGDHFLAGARLALHEHRSRARGDPGDQSVHVEHRRALAHQRVLSDGMRLDDGQCDRGFGDGARAAQRAQEILTPHREREHVEHSQFFGPQHQAHRRAVCDGDQARRGGRAAQCIHPPGKIVVRVLAQHGDHDVPPPGA